MDIPKAHTSVPSSFAHFWRAEFTCEYLFVGRPMLDMQGKGRMMALFFPAGN